MESEWHEQNGRNNYLFMYGWPSVPPQKKSLDLTDMNFNLNFIDTGKKQVLALIFYNDLTHY